MIRFYGWVIVWKTVLLLLIFLPVLLLNVMVLNRSFTIKGPVVQESAIFVPLFGYWVKGWTLLVILKYRPPVAIPVLLPHTVYDSLWDRVREPRACPQASIVSTLFCFFVVPFVCPPHHVWCSVHRHVFWLPIIVLSPKKEEWLAHNMESHYVCS